MSRKDKSKKGGEGKWNTGDELQAVVIADSFNYRFLPITTEQPRALLPLVNRPLIDYTVEFLAVAGVKEIFVFCSDHAEKIKAHLDRSRWMQPHSPVKLHTVVVSENCHSVGDALRIIDAQSLIRSDFVLVSGDLVANMELKEMIEQHKKTKEKDKMAVMTCVYKEAKPYHPTRSSEDDIFIVTSTSKRLLHCEKPKKKKKLGIPPSIFEENHVVDIHYDVLDCHVSICDPCVPQLFSDNFDYQTRHHFIRGILFNEDITGSHIYTRIISDQYAARVSNLHTYDAISKDVIHRWVYPLVPDNITEESYSYGWHNIYLSNNVSLAMGTSLEEDVVIGQESTIGPNSHISHSSIGHNCIIGKNVKIEDAYIWDDVVVGDNCDIRRAILCDRVRVHSGVTVGEGCILSYDVVVDCNITLRPGCRLTTKRQSQVGNSFSDLDWGDDAESSHQQESIEPESMVEYVGENGCGFLWEPPIQSPDDKELDDFVEEWPDVQMNLRRLSDIESSGSSCSSERAVSVEVVADNIIFYNEILDCIRSGVAELVTNENTILMINASKHAYNIPIGDVPLAVAKALMEGPQNSTTWQASELLLYIKNAISHLESLLQHYIKGRELQLNVIQVLAEHAEQYGNAMEIFPKVILLLYDADIIEEAPILEWYTALQGLEQAALGSSVPFPAKSRELLISMNPIAEWLKNAEEESSDEEQ